MAAFLHDPDCIFGEAKDALSLVVRAQDANCERYEGKGCTFRRWIGGEYTMQEMLIGGEQVYMEEKAFPMTTEGE